MAVKRRRPQDGGIPEKVIPPLGWLFLACGIVLYFLAFQLPWFGQYCIWIGNISLFLGFGCLLYWLFIHQDEIFNLRKNMHLSRKIVRLDIIKTSAMKDFLFQSKAVVLDPYDPRYQQLPDVEQTKRGLKIEAIGNLRQWLISDGFRESLESFLNLHGYDVFIQSAHYHSDGWVYYNLIKGVKSDRLRFK